jgi:hypothetical protein
MRVHEMIKAKKNATHIQVYMSMHAYSNFHRIFRPTCQWVDDLILPELQTASLLLKDRMVNENSANSGIN